MAKRENSDSDGEGEPAAKRVAYDQFPYAPGFVGADLRERLLLELGGLADTDTGLPLNFVPKMNNSRTNEATGRGTMEAISPTLYAWFADDARIAAVPYAFSKRHANPLRAQPFFPALRELRDRVQAQMDEWQPGGAPFNAALVNFYADGGVALDNHKDQDAWFGEPGGIRVASISLGATRRFALKHDTDKDRNRVLDLEDGSLAAMLGDAQVNWTHGIRGTKANCGPRINITFRAIDTSPESMAAQRRSTGVATEIPDARMQEILAREAALTLHASMVVQSFNRT
jgi:alkylated DNA repair dioxygenase AlkB